MSHALIIIKPPYGTQMITQHDGTIMLKFELERKKDMTDMFQKAIDEIVDYKLMVPPRVIPPAPPKGAAAVTSSVTKLPGPPAYGQVSRVVPDDGTLPRMAMVAPPAMPVATNPVGELFANMTEPASEDSVKKLQAILGVAQDGVFGPVTDAALQALKEGSRGQSDEGETPAQDS